MTHNDFVIDIAVKILYAVFNRISRFRQLRVYCQVAPAMRTCMPVLIFQYRFSLKILSAFHAMTVMPVGSIEQTVALNLLGILKKGFGNRTHFSVIRGVLTLNIFDMPLQAVGFFPLGYLMLKVTKRRLISVAHFEIAVKAAGVY